MPRKRGNSTGQAEARAGKAPAGVAGLTAPSLRSGEDCGEVAAVRTAGRVDIADADLGVVWAEQIGAVGRAVHPPGERRLRCLRRSVAGGEDVFPDPRPAIALGVDALADGRAVGTRVRKEIATGHVGAVQSGRALQLALRGIGRKALRGALLVDQSQQGAFESGVPTWIAARIRGRRG